MARASPLARRSSPLLEFSVPLDIVLTLAAITFPFAPTVDHRRRDRAGAHSAGAASRVDTRRGSRGGISARRRVLPAVLLVPPPRFSFWNPQNTPVPRVQVDTRRKPPHPQPPAAIAIVVPAGIEVEIDVDMRIIIVVVVIRWIACPRRRPLIEGVAAAPEPRQRNARHGARKQPDSASFDHLQTPCHTPDLRNAAGPRSLSAITSPRGFCCARLRGGFPAWTNASKHRGGALRAP